MSIIDWKMIIYPYWQPIPYDHNKTLHNVHKRSHYGCTVKTQMYNNLFKFIAQIGKTKRLKLFELCC